MRPQTVGGTPEDDNGRMFELILVETQVCVCVCVCVFVCVCVCMGCDTGCDMWCAYMVCMGCDMWCAYIHTHVMHVMPWHIIMSCHIMS